MTDEQFKELIKHLAAIEVALAVSVSLLHTMANGNEMAPTVLARVEDTIRAFEDSFGKPKSRA